MPDKKLNILIVEDNPADSALLVETLKTSGVLKFEYIMADRLSSAFEKIKTQKVDIIMLDMGLPDSTGLETVMKMKEKAGRIPIIVLTGTDSFELSMKVLQSGAQDYFNKSEMLLSGMVEKSVRYSLERAKLAGDILESEKRHRLIFERASNMILVIRHDGIISECNERTAKILGYAREFLSGKSVLDFIPGRSRGLVEEALDKAWEQGELLNTEGMLMKNDNSVINVKMNCSVLKDGDENDVLIMLVEDITESKQSEKIYKHAFEKLKEVNDMKSSFISIVSHELRTPLTIIKGYGTFLEKGMAGDLNAQQTEYLAMITSNVSRLGFLINDMVDISKIESGKFSIFKKKTNILQTIKKSAAGEAFIAAKTGVEVKVQAELKDMDVFCDPDRLEQVLTNLIGNAVKFSPKGAAVSVGYEKASNEGAPEHMRVQLGSEKREYVIIYVKDEGAGVDIKNLEKIFDKFYQVESTNTRRHGGLGLGLNICKSIAQAHEGQIWAESEGKNKGTTMKIMLPVESRESECNYLSTCVFYKRFENDAAKKKYIQEYCDGRFYNCNRKKLKDKGEKPPEHMLPDGSVEE